MLEILPVHILKLRWLIGQETNLNIDDRVSVTIIVQEWESDNYKKSETELISKVNDLYARYRV